MPELPEIETTLRGIAPYLENQTIAQVTVRNHQLRWPIQKDLPVILKEQKVISIKRRAKYLLINLQKGTLILHLGMSGSLRLLLTKEPFSKHDHLDIEFQNKMILRFRDPRRFGACLLTFDDIAQHQLLKHLGPEPLTLSFTGQYLWQKGQARSIPIKTFIMDNKVVVGVGNIYASESLFLAAIHPLKPVKSLTLDEMNQLVKAIKAVLKKAIKAGGTTLKDFVNSSGNPGYFSQSLNVYGRDGQPCFVCQNLIKSIVTAQRNTFYCEKCQNN